MGSKQWICLGMLGLLFSCKNWEADKKEPLNVVADGKKEISKDEAQTMVIFQKIEEYVDRSKLRLRHPEFNQEIQEKSLFKTAITEHMKLAGISKIDQRILGDSTILYLKIRLRDSVQSYTDTLKVVLITKKMELRGEIATTTNILFQKR